jgi:hypothetical protein
MTVKIAINRKSTILNYLVTDCQIHKNLIHTSPLQLTPHFPQLTEYPFPLQIS